MERLVETPGVPHSSMGAQPVVETPGVGNKAEPQVVETLGQLSLNFPTTGITEPRSPRN